MSKLTIVIPSFNNYADLEKTLTSIVQPKREKIEIIIVDSSINHDQVRSLVALFSSRYKCLYVDPLGVYNAMNKVLSTLAEGYVLFLNSGDVLLVDIDSILLVLKRTKSQVIIFRQNTYYKGEYIYTFNPNLYSIWPHQSTVYKADLHGQFGFYDEKATIVADQLFFKKLKLSQEVTKELSDYILAGYDLSGISSGCSYPMIKELVLMEPKHRYKIYIIIKGIIRCNLLKLLGVRGYFLLTGLIYKRYTRV